MNQQEKIDKIYDIIIRIEPMVLNHQETLYRDETGIKERLSLMEQRQKDCPARAATSTDNKRYSLSVAMMVIAMISLLINVGLSLHGIFGKG